MVQSDWTAVQEISVRVKKRAGAAALTLERLKSFSYFSDDVRTQMLTCRYLIHVLQLCNTASTALYHIIAIVANTPTLYTTTICAMVASQSALEIKQHEETIKTLARYWAWACWHLKRVKFK